MKTYAVHRRGEEHWCQSGLMDTFLPYRQVNASILIELPGNFEDTPDTTLLR